MFKCFSHFFACLLLVLIPLQGFAAANMSICNSIMQSSAQQAMRNMPCHDSMSSNEQHAKKHHQQSSCKTSCAALCASLGAMTVLPSNMPAASFLASSSLMHMPHQPYASITQPNLQRPPIFLA
jgi:hypothetical protein